MAKSAQIKRINYTHEALANWMIENPHRPLSDAALYFDVSRSWLSTIIHSDIFQNHLAKKNAEVFTQIAEDIPSRLKGLTAVGLDRLENIMETTTDKKFVKESVEMLLSKQGFGNPKQVAQPAVQVNNFTVSSKDLADARALQQSVQTKFIDVVPTMVEVSDGNA